MLVNGLHIERKAITVDVDVDAVIQKLFDYWKSSIGHQYQDICNGEWETWTYTGHGSGLTTSYGKATPHQIDVYDSFVRMFTFAKEYKKKHS